MASYIVLSPPSRELYDEKTVIIKDGFSIWAALFTWIWALRYGLFLEAAVLFLLQTAASLIPLESAYAMPIAVTAMLVSLLWGFEARNWRADRLQAKGWALETTLVAETMGDAEAMIFGEVPRAEKSAKAAPITAKHGSPTVKHGSLGLDYSGLGLIDIGKGRA